MFLETKSNIVPKLLKNMYVCGGALLALAHCQWFLTHVIKICEIFITNNCLGEIHSRNFINNCDILINLMSKLKIELKFL